jgi:hypothetical protein
MAERG